LDKNTIPLLDTKIICGASNLPVATEEDHALMMNNKILYVTDVVPNRMVKQFYIYPSEYIELLMQTTLTMSHRVM